MFKLKAKESNYGILIPESIDGFTKEYFDNILSEIDIPNHYAVVALCRKVDLYSMAFAITNRNSNDLDAVIKVKTILAKFNEDDESYNKILNTGKIIDISRSDIEMGLHLIVEKCGISYNNISKYLNTNTSLCNSIVKGLYRKDGTTSEFAMSKSLGKPNYGNVFALEFKIVPTMAIKAIHNGKGSTMSDVVYDKEE